MGPHLLGMIGAALVGTCGVLTAMEYFAAQGRAAPRGCEDFEARPTAGWVTLVDCELDFEHAVVSDEVGHERLVDRLEGVSRMLHDSPPTWSQVLVPLSSPRHGPVRVMVALSDPGHRPQRPGGLDQRILGGLGLGALVWGWVGRRRRGEVTVGGLDVSDVKLELGELALLERDRRGPKKIEP